MPSPPWRITLRQFVDAVRRDYGISLRTFGFPMIGPRGPIYYTYLERDDLTETFALMTEVGEDDLLTPSLLRSLCHQLGLPSEDFYLDPEEED